MFLPKLMEGSKSLSYAVLICIHRKIILWEMNISNIIEKAFFRLALAGHCLQ